MKIKEFLKPTLVKIIIFLIISSVFIPFIYYHILDKGVPIFNPFGNSILIYLFDLVFRKIGIYHISYPILIVGLVISYLLSSLITYSINKLREKKK